jgi:hypothetical protein
MPLTYRRMVLRQHATQELQHPLSHRKRIHVPSEIGVRRSKVPHSRACKSSQINTPRLTLLNPHAAPLHTCPSPIEGWSSGSTRRLISSALSPIASASACLPRLKYVTARLFMAMPARQVKSILLASRSSIHTQHHSTHAPHLCQDGPQAARDA